MPRRRGGTDGLAPACAGISAQRYLVFVSVGHKCSPAARVRSGCVYSHLLSRTARERLALVGEISDRGELSDIGISQPVSLAEAAWQAAAGQGPAPHSI